VQFLNCCIKTFSAKIFTMNYFRPFLIIFYFFSAQFAVGQCPGQIEALLNIVPDNYGSETTWEFTGPGGAPLYASGGPYTDGVMTPINQSVCLDSNTLVTFTIYDGYGDGICCTYGNGSYSVTIDGSVVASGGQFLASESTVVSGTLMSYDASMIQLNTPYSKVSNLENATISGTIINVGSTTLGSIDLSYQVGNQAVVSETFSLSNIVTFDEFEYSFVTPWVPAAIGVQDIRVWIDDLNASNADMDNNNDTIVVAVDVYQAVVPPNVLDDYLLAPPVFSTIATAAQQIDKPMDLDFHPYRSNELWVINEEDVSGGGTTVTIYDAGLPAQSSVFKEDGNNWHFMSLPTGIAFGTNGNFASSPGVFDANHNNTEFTGPTLWSSDMSIYAQYAGPGTNGSHLDMLHESPHSMGIAHHKDNAYWVFDGFNTDIVLYDFKADHGPGMSYHGDAVIKRYEEVNVARDAIDPMIPSHLVLNKSNGWLYIADVGNDRVIRMNTASGNVGAPLVGLEQLAAYNQMVNVVQETVVDSGLIRPCGIDILDDRMILGDYQTGDIRFYDISVNPASYLGKISTGASGLTGLKIGPQGNIWFTNRLTEQVRKVVPSVATEVATLMQDIQFEIYPNPSKSNFTLDFSQKMVQAVVRITDAGGKLIYRTTIKGSDKLVLNGRNWSKGIYFVHVSTGEQTTNRKLIKY
jgi:hypothetical protein